LTKLVLIGVGRTALAVNQAESSKRYDTVIGTTRQSAKLEFLEENHIQPILLSTGFSPDSLSDESLSTLNQLCENAHVLVSFPPNESDDQVLSRIVENADKVVYISSTGVYGATSGVIDENSAVEFDNPSIKPRLQAEEIWRSIGATILRAPALYSPDYGLHLSLKTGKYKIPGDGNRYSSRIHLDDLATIIHAAFLKAQAGSLYVVGDDKPATHLEVVTWLCKRLSLPLPESIPLQDAHVTLRANRQINAQKVKAEFDVVLKYPTYVEGFEHCLRAH
jgi:hypothetical protein